MWRSAVLRLTLLAAAGCSSAESAAVSAETSLTTSLTVSSSATATTAPSASASASSGPDGGAEPVDGGAPSAAPSEAGPPPPERAARAVVDLAGGTTYLPLPDAERPRLAVVKWLTRVRQKPDQRGKVLGYLRAGAVVVAGEEQKKASRGCPDGWRALEPGGWVCLSDLTADLQHPLARATSRRPDHSLRLPYMYGTVRWGGPVYARIPTEEQLKKHEPDLAEHYRKWREDKDSGAGYGLDVWLRYQEGRKVPDALQALEQRYTDEDIPWFLQGGATVPPLSLTVQKKPGQVRVDTVSRRQGRSFSFSFLHEGRRYNVTPDLVVIPADLFRPIRGSSFHGWQVDRELSFPFALVRRPGARKWLWDKDKERMKDGGELSWRTAVRLTGKLKMYQKKLHYETKEGFWVDDRHASRVDPAKRWPKWAKQGAKWIDISLGTQVLVAYEGQKMVYATLISSGEGSLDPEHPTATERGIFRIHTKWISTTMDSDEVGEEFELRDVPYVQYFKEGYALHGAYWHDGFGRPKSHGCINLSPEDARRLFFWTDPPLPPGWHGVRTSRTGTRVFVHL